MTALDDRVRLDYLPIVREVAGTATDEVARYYRSDLFTMCEACAIRLTEIEGPLCSQCRWCGW